MLRLGILAAAGAAAAVVLVGGSTAYPLQFLLDKIAYGTSNAATLFALAFVAALTLPWPATRVTAWRNVAVGALGCGFGLHAAVAIAWLLDNRIPLDAMVVVWRDGANSFVSWQHSHLGKAGLALLAWSVGGVDARYDTGSVFLPEVPAIVAVVLAGCMALAVPATIGWYAALRRTAGSGWGWPHHLLFAVAAIVALKTQLDGGIVAHGALASLVVLASFAIAPRPERFDRCWRSWGAAALIAATCLSAAWVWICSHGEFPALGSELFYTALYAALVLCARTPARPWVPATLALYLAINTWVDAETRLVPMLAALPAGSSSFEFDAQGVRLTGPHDVAGRSVWEVFERAGEDPRKPRHTLLGWPGVAGIRSLPLEVRVRRVQPGGGAILQPGDGSWRIHDVQAERDTLRLRIELTDTRLPPLIGAAGGATAHHNLQVYLHWVAARLRAAGVSEFLAVMRRQAG